MSAAADPELETSRSAKYRFDELLTACETNPVGSDGKRPEGTLRLRDFNVSKTRLSGLDLRDVDLSEADLSGSDLQNADLSGANLKGALLEGTDLTGAILRGANLESAHGLKAWQFRDTDTSGTKLPEAIAEFKGIDSVGKIAPAVAKQFFVVLGTSLYCWLTIATTTDLSLILGSATQALPIVQTPIPIVGFYYFGPFLLLVAFLYFQLNLQRMWEALAKLPAIFPDGRRLDERVYPWLLIQKVRAHFKRLRDSYTVVPWLENVLGSALAYGAVPLTLLAFWFRSLVKHSPALTAWQVFLLTISLLVALQFHHYAVATLRGSPSGGGISAPSAKRISICLGAGALLVVASQQLDSVLGPNLTNAEICIKPAGWVDGQSDLTAVKAARLAGVDLRNARMDNAFAAKADLDRAQLESSSLFEADLRSASLGFAKLGSSDLIGANLQGASLYKADLAGANLAASKLQGAILSGANFDGANFSDAYLNGAKLNGARLHNANLSVVFGLTAEQLKSAQIDNTTKLPPGLPRP